MCISPITIPTRSHVLRVDGYKSLYLTVPCGHCRQCREKNSISWAIRSAYEYKYCVEAGGYALFDTLTYDDENVPRYWQFIPEAWRSGFADEMTFDKTHVQKFLKRLRINMLRLGYDAKDKFRYMVCSEYGTDPTKTHRPHYHLFLYVNNGIPPVELSALIARTWKFGRTDGVPYKSAQYVLNNRVFASLSEHGLNAAKYCQKYIVKGSPYDRKVIKDCYNMLSTLHEDLSWNDKATLKRWIRIVSSWHIQSKYFGLSSKKILPPVLEAACRLQDSCAGAFGDGALSEAVIEDYGFKIKMPRFGRCEAYDLPRYYEDKIFKEDVKTYGSSVRRFKKSARPYLEARLVRLLNCTKRVYQDMPLADKEAVKDILNGRSLTDYFIYKSVYDGRLGCPSGNPLADYLKGQLVDDGFHDGSHPLFVYACPNDIRRFDRAVCSYKYLGRSTGSKYLISKEIKDKSLQYAQDDLSLRQRDVLLDIFPLSQVKCLDSSFKPFNRFNEIDDIFSINMLRQSIERENTLRERSLTRYKYKKCGMLN